jgi:preprotein translocase subunit SecB
MRASQLRLDRYWVDELCFSFNEAYQFEPDAEPVLLPEDLEVVVEPRRNPDNPLEWYFELSVKLPNKAGRFPYTFSIKLTGFFEVQKDCPPSEIDQLALVNSPSILYASARELLAMTTGRGRMLSMVLPSITFYEAPKKDAKPAETKQQEINPVSKKAVSKRPSGKAVSKKK